KPVQEENKSESQVPEQKEEIAIDDFMKLDLRVAEVVKAEPVKKTNKLLKLQLDAGTDKRQVVSGIAEYYNPEDLIGKKVIFVTNLTPVKRRVEKSESMSLCDEDYNGQDILTYDEQSLIKGSIVK